MALPIGSNGKDLCPGQRLEKGKNCHNQFIVLQDGYIGGWFFRKCDRNLFHFYACKSDHSWIPPMAKSCCPIHGGNGENEVWWKPCLVGDAEGFPWFWWVRFSSSRACGLRGGRGCYNELSGVILSKVTWELGHVGVTCFLEMRLVVQERVVDDWDWATQSPGLPPAQQWGALRTGSKRSTWGHWVSGFWPFFYHLLDDSCWTSLLISLSLDSSIHDMGSARLAPLSPSWRVIVGIHRTEDLGTLWKSTQISITVGFYYLLGTNSPVWVMLEPGTGTCSNLGGILGNNQSKMHWVGAMLRVINLDSLLLEKINNAWEEQCKNLQEGK